MHMLVFGKEKHKQLPFHIRLNMVIFSLYSAFLFIRSNLLAYSLPEDALHAVQYHPILSVLYRQGFTDRFIYLATGQICILFCALQAGVLSTARKPYFRHLAQYLMHNWTEFWRENKKISSSFNNNSNGKITFGRFIRNALICLRELAKLLAIIITGKGAKFKRKSSFAIDLHLLFRHLTSRNRVRLVLILLVLECIRFIVEILCK